MYDRRDLGLGQRRSRPVARQVAGQIHQALCFGRGQYRRDTDLLPAAAAPQAYEGHRQARTHEPGDQAAHACGANLPRQRAPSAAGAGARPSRPARTGWRATSTWSISARIRKRLAGRGRLMVAGASAAALSGAPRRPRPHPPKPGILLNLTATTNVRATSAGHRARLGAWSSIIY